VGLSIMTTQPEFVEQLFEAALALEPDERESFIDRACSQDPELMRTVRELLTEDANAGSFLEHPPFDFLDQREIRPSLADNTDALGENETASAQPGGRLAPNQILIDRFVIVRFIAKGGMGEIYEAADCLLQGAQVAVKIILPQIAHDPDLQQRFEWEVLLARQVNHSNLCPIYDIFHCHQPAPSFLFLTMKLLPGETLATRLRRTASISTAEGMAILKQMAAGLAAIHAAGIVHRDIKPGNIMLDSVGSDVRLCITDFGLASAYTTAASLPAHELAAGTPDYMAPELHRGLEPSQASDLFAFGVVLHQVFTGQKPLLTPDKSSVIVSPRLNTSGIPSFCVKLITGCLDSDPQRRCQAFVSALGSPQIKY
jgi:tRNA A-37 threonylcarbamoyl transferase component Bud32